jgi:hypothetical protein
LAARLVPYTIFPTSEGLQTRIVTVNWHSDTNTAALNFSTGSNVVAITATNIASTYQTQYVNSTVGLVTNSWCILEHAGAAYLSLLVATNNGTNAVFTNALVALSGGFGVLSSVGDNIYMLGSSNSIPIGASTNWQSGEAIYVADRPSRPVLVQLSPALTTNRINSVTARYE